MDLQFMLLEQHKKLVEYISNFCNQINFGQDIFPLYFLCFIMQIGAKYYLKPPYCSTIHHKAGGQSEPSWVNVFQNLWACKLSFLWTSSVFTSGSRQLKPYIQTNDKFREAFSKHLRPIWKAFWHTWRLHVDMFTKPFSFLSVKLRYVHLIYYWQFYQHLDHHFQGMAIVIMVFHHLLDKIINFSASNTLVAWPIKYLFTA